jgi:4-amino-4-deoxy-L-arabinose transferase-like glycosyltransferase
MNRRTVLALLGLCIALRAVSLVRPCLSDDEAIYATVAREMLTGHELYRDVVDHKPPGIYVVYAATQAVGGPVGGMVVLHLVLIGAVFATALLLARIVRLHWPGTDPRAPAAAAVLWIV